MKMKCPYCGSHRVVTAEGERGDPFDRRPDKSVCLDCGMTLGGGVKAEPYEPFHGKEIKKWK